MRHTSAPVGVLAMVLALLACMGACSVDVGKLRAAWRGDASRMDASRMDAEPSDPGPRRDAGTAGTDVPRSGSGGIGGSGSGGSMGMSDVDGVVDVSSGPDVEAPAAGNDVGAADEVVVGTGDDPDGGATLMGFDAASDARDVVAAEEAGSGDLPPDAVMDVGDDLSQSDTPGQLTCPMTIAGSLDATDPVQIGRVSRVTPTSTCGTKKVTPGTDADPTNPHIYDVYHVTNPSSAAVCMTFTLTHPGAQQLYASAYVSFNPNAITVGYLGDVGAVLVSPQTMGLTVAARSTIDVVVYSTAIGAVSAGAYTLSCSSQ